MNKIEDVFESILSSIKERPADGWALPPNTAHARGELLANDEFLQPLFPPGHDKDYVPSFDPLDDSDEKKIDSALESEGIEAIAFYKSYRYRYCYPFPGQWGIFYWDMGLARIVSQAKQYFHNDPKIDQQRLPLLAIDFLRKHEFYHFLADVHSLNIEALVGRSLRRNLDKTYRPLTCCEETLANLFALKSARRNGLGDWVFSKISRQPGAYGDIYADRNLLKTQWISDLLDERQNSKHLRPELSHWVTNFTDDFNKPHICPEWVFSKSVGSWLYQYTYIGPRVDSIDVVPKLLSELDVNANLNKLWESCKTKLLQDPSLPGLDFGRWYESKSKRRTKGKDNPNEYSARLDDNFRMHLLRSREIIGHWTAFKWGPHKPMGHG